MNQHVPDWTTEDETGCFTDLLPMTNQKNPMGPDNDLMEQLWRNGHVVMQSRSHRRAPGNLTELKQTQKPDQVQKHEHSLGNSSNLFQEADTSWFQYPLDDSFEKEFCSEFFCEFASTDTVVSDKITKDSIAEEDRLFRFGSNNDSDAFTASATNQCTSPIQENTMPLARLHCVGSTPQSSCLDNGGVQNSSHFSKSTKADFGSLSKAGAQESSMMTVGSSACGSNQIQSQTDPSNNLQDDAAGVVIAGIKVDTGMRSISERMQSKAHEMTVSSSSGDSGYSYGRSRHQNESNQSHKRKGRDMEDSECQSEEPEYESTEGKRPVQRPISKRRSRAAEVHNLSERKRRDRINEKMKALQELIPHCNKTDKASMLDQAIEYLKSLQLQVQMMWMGSSMASMMFPEVQQYISGMGMGHTSISAIHNALQLPRVPFANRFVVSVSSANPTSLFSSPAINAVNSLNQMQNIHLPESYAQCLGWHTMQPHQMQNIHLPESYAQCLGWHTMQPHQATKFCTYGSHMVQQNQSAVACSSSHLPSAGGPNSTHTSG